MNTIRRQQPLKWWYVAFTDGERRIIASPHFLSIWKIYGRESILYTRIIQHDANGTEIIPREAKINPRTGRKQPRRNVSDPAPVAERGFSYPEMGKFIG